MSKKIDLSNQKIGMLNVIRPVDKNKFNNIIWECKCDCGNTVNILSGNLRKKGHTTSCGCYKIKNQTHHSMHKTRFYNIWRQMKSRCLSKCNDNYKDYGGRGITVCDRWLEFINFKEDMYESYLLHVKLYGEKDTSIDRENNNKGYSKDNCRWATCKVQANNKRDRINQKQFKATSPDGVEFISNNQSEFARIHNLNHTKISLCLLERNGYKTHKKWKFIYI